MIKIYPQVKPLMQSSKWLDCPLLVDRDEMANLLGSLGEFYIVLTGVTSQGKEIISLAEFLDCYGGYVEALKRGELPEDGRLRSYFSAVITSSLDILYKVMMGEGQQLVKAERPVIQLQMHRFHYSKDDHKFRSMVFGQDAVYWGIQFAYPQLFQDESHLVKQVKEGDEFPNTRLFKALQRWVRQHTLPTPFVIQDRQVNIPMRLGKACFPWINQHPQLASLGVRVSSSLPQSH